MRQRQDARTLLFADRSPVDFALLLILLLGSSQCPKLVVPVGLERIRYKPIRRVHVKVAALRQIGLIPRSLDLLLTQTVHLFQLGLNLLLDGQRDFQRQGRDRVDEKLADSLIKMLTKDMLAYRDDVVSSVTLAHILRYNLGLSRVVANHHPAATHAADNQACNNAGPSRGGLFLRS